MHLDTQAAKEMPLLGRWDAPHDANSILTSCDLQDLAEHLAVHQGTKRRIRCPQHDKSPSAFTSVDVSLPADHQK